VHRAQSLRSARKCAATARLSCLFGAGPTASSQGGQSAVGAGKASVWQAGTAPCITHSLQHCLQLRRGALFCDARIRACNREAMGVDYAGEQCRGAAVGSAGEGTEHHIDAALCRPAWGYPFNTTHAEPAPAQLSTLCNGATVLLETHPAGG
jgi:hypothetical protein